MTDCNLEPVRFPSCKGRLVEASFSGGAVLLRQVWPKVKMVFRGDGFFWYVIPK